MSTEYLIPVCKDHGLNSATMHTVEAAKGNWEGPEYFPGYFEKFPSLCGRMSCGKPATQFIRIEVGL